MSKIPLILFALTAIIAALLLFSLLRPEGPTGHGVPHTEFSEMNHGGNADRHDSLIVIGGLYGGLQIVFFVTVLCFGIRRDRSTFIPLIVGGVAYFVVFAAMSATYARGMDSAPIVLGLPLPTSLMVFGMWGIPVVFVILYIANFRSWIYNDDDAQRFAELLQESTQDTSSGRQVDG